MPIPFQQEIPSSEPIQVLDHGYVKFIEHYGCDERIVEAARMSTFKGFVSWEPYWECEKCLEGMISYRELTKCPECDGKVIHKKEGDFGLMRHLVKKKHTGPFEFAGMVLEIQGPLMVFREWHRHRTQSYNEMSARYVKMPNLHYNPTVARAMSVSKDNKQAMGVKEVAEFDEEHIRQWLRDGAVIQGDIYNHYERGLELGVAKEVARYNTPVSRYSRMRASANLHNWLRFISLRCPPDAQWEIRMFANQVVEYVRTLYPRTWKLFEERLS